MKFFVRFLPKATLFITTIMSIPLYAGQPILQCANGNFLLSASFAPTDVSCEATEIIRILQGNAVQNSSVLANGGRPLALPARAVGDSINVLLRCRDAQGVENISSNNLTATAACVNNRSTAAQRNRAVAPAPRATRSPRQSGRTPEVRSARANFRETNQERFRICRQFGRNSQQCAEARQEVRNARATLNDARTAAQR